MSNIKVQKNVHQKHVLARANFMYQASMLMAGQQQNTLSSYYGELCKRICTRSTQRISPDIKRNLCKRCSLSLQPGITAELTMMSSNAATVGTAGTAAVDSNDIQDEYKTIKRKRKRRRKSKKSTVSSAVNGNEIKLTVPQINGHKDVACSIDERPKEHDDKDAAQSNGTHSATLKAKLNDTKANEQSSASHAVAANNEHQTSCSTAATSDSLPSTTLRAPSDTIDEHLHMEISCSLCQYKRRFRVNSDHHFWLDNPESLHSETMLQLQSEDAHRTSSKRKK